MAAFKAGKNDVLIATDVAARGIDVDDVTHVINHTIPDDDKAYLHRAGRTGRAGKTGIAVTFVDWDDLHKWALINRALEFGQPEPVETYSSCPHLFPDLDIPAGTKGRLKPASPRPRRRARAPRAAARDAPRATPSAHRARGRVAAPAAASPQASRRAPARDAPTGRRAPPRSPAPARTTARATSTTTATRRPAPSPSPRTPHGRRRRTRGVSPHAASARQRALRRRMPRPRALARRRALRGDRRRAAALGDDALDDVGRRAALAEPVGLARAVVVARPGDREAEPRAPARAAAAWRRRGSRGGRPRGRTARRRRAGASRSGGIDPLGAARARDARARARRRPRGSAARR